MMRKYLILISVVMAVSIPTVPAAAQDKPAAPAKAAMSEKRGKIVRDAPDALRVEDMTMEELQQRLAEYEAGKRDYRDGYIILNQLWFNYQAERKTTSSEFQAVVKKRDGLLTKYPALSNLQDFRLSDRKRHEDRRRSEAEQKKRAAARWQPSDEIPVRLVAKGNRLIAIYQFKLAFFSSTQTIELGPEGSAVPTLREGGAESSLDKLKREKVATFRHRVQLAQEQPKVSDRVLVCTNAVADHYSGMTPEEDAMIVARGHTHGSMPWENTAASKEHFCGIYASDGSVVLEFPAQFTKGRTAWKPVGISESGDRATVAIGTLKKVETEDGSYMKPSAPWEVWTWSQGSTKHFRVPEASDHDLRRRFFQNNL